MPLDRRALLAAAAAAFAVPAAAQEPPAPPPPEPAPTTEQRLSAAALENRLPMRLDGGTFSGAGWDLLVREGRDARFFQVGEEHGIAENPRLCAALFEALRPAGYDRLAIEISPPMATVLDEAARGGLDGLRALFADPAAMVAFYTMREEAGMLARVRAAVPGTDPVLWGLDYEVAGDRRLIALLAREPKPAEAEVALAAVKAASDAAWTRYAESRNLGQAFSFSGDPALVRDLRAAWRQPSPRSAWILDTLEQTLAINRRWIDGQGYASNQARADFNRANLLRHLRAEPGRKVMFKMGASHLVRGLNYSEVFDIGSLAAEIAGIEGGHAFSVMVLPGLESQVAVLNPETLSYRSAAAKDQYAEGLEPLTGQVFPDGYTLFDLRPLRRLLPSQRARTAHRELARVVHGFDALLVMTGSTPSANL